uniref:Uncharacterized protein n=1 Tax=Arundo donax TaxID=35708 RepID=A0A0A8XPV1_ARUDO
MYLKGSVQEQFVHMPTFRIVRCHSLVQLAAQLSNLNQDLTTLSSLVKQPCAPLSDVSIDSWPEKIS